MVGMYPYGEDNTKATDSLGVSAIVKLSMMPLLYVLQRKGVGQGA